MATDEPPSLITLPRELRNLIYDELTVNIDVAIDQGKERAPYRRRHRMRLIHAPSPNVLRINHQVREEYLDYIAPKAKLSVHLTGQDVFALPVLLFRANVPSVVLERIKFCKINLGWWNIIDKKSSELTKSWHQTCALQGYDKQELMPWTPTKGKYV